MKAWPKVALGDVCISVERFVTPTAGTAYRQLGVRLWGEGAYERETIDGADTKYSKLNRIEANDLVVNKIWARNGSVAVATQELAGTHVSGEFPTFALDKGRTDPRWIRLITKWRGFWNLCDEKAQGTSGKNRIKPSQFLAIRIPLPPLAEQQALVSRLDTLAYKVRQVNEHLDAIERDADRLLAVRFRDAIAGAPVRPMAEVAPLVRREIAIELEGSYPELGIRSFGKGTFHKPPLSGAGVGTKRLFSIEPGDLLFSNVFAWEGAIAVAQPENAGRFGSHRFITCRVDPDITSPEFLRYYFLTDDGLGKIGEASPGGAGRNRTLGLEKLMAIEVPIPSLATQRTFETLQTKVAELKARHATIRQANDALIPATLERVFSEAH
ncbi:MAG: restriction endonuclease subunit S [Pseudomonadota bacterium]|jgi:type I restriction enzyme S subunit